METRIHESGKGMLALIAALMAAIALSVAPAAAYAEDAGVAVWRLYNQWSGEHLFTTDRGEYDSLVGIGWSGEGEAWDAPSEGDEVFRLYNPYSGDHHYTMDQDEYGSLGSIGWRQEGVVFHSAGASSGAPIYRLFNPWLTQGTHLFTTDKGEYDNLGQIGWQQEGIAFYSVAHAFSVSFDANGGAGAPEGATATEAKASHTFVIPAAIPTFSGYEFASWNTKADGTGDSYQPGATIAADSANPTIILYAQWQLPNVKYVLSYDANGGDGAPEADSVTERKASHTFTVTSEVPVRKGYYFSDSWNYDFVSWNTKPDGTGKSYTAGDKIDLTSSTPSVTLYAQWKAEVTAQGTFGDGCSWTLAGDGTLTVAPTDGESGTMEPIYLIDGFRDICSKIRTIVIDPGVKAPANSQMLFYGADGINGGMSYLTRVNASNLDTSSVTDMTKMFADCRWLNDISSIGTWNVQNVTKMDSMFEGSSIRNIDALADWKTSKLESLNGAFQYCDFRDVNGLKNWDVSNVSNMYGTFWGCSSLTNVDALQHWNVSKVEDMTFLFEGCSSLSDINGLMDWDVSSVGRNGLDYTFGDCISLRDASPIDDWNVANGNQYNTFKGCPATPPTWYKSE